MPLKITLRPHERVLVGGAAITNGGSRCDLMVENNVPVLREKDILRSDDATTPCRRIYLAVQLMYVDEPNLADHHAAYWSLVRDLVAAAPRTLGMIDHVSEHILGGNYYHALKQARKLIDYEEEALAYARSSDRGIPEEPESHHVGARGGSSGPYQGGTQAEGMPE